MSSFPIIFPSLSRQPSMDSSKSTDDDTIRDAMESGYVATRPRFTRARRTWKINYRNLQAEDIRALDEFFMVTVGRGGNSFLYPNLLPNWSFEFPAVSAADLVFGWNIASTPAQASIGVTGVTVADGVQAVSFATLASTSIPAHTTVNAELDCDAIVPCDPGEIYVFTAQMQAFLGSLASGVMVPSVGIRFQNAAGALLSTATSALTVATGWSQVGYQFTVPAAAASFQVYLNLALVNSTGSAIALDGSASIVFDEACCALLTPLTPYGRMAGSSPLGCLVRFSKLPENSDIGWGNGVKRYGANLELTEV